MANKQENKSDEKGLSSKEEDIKQIPEKEESKVSKDSSQQIKLATGENDGTAPNDSEYNQGKWTDEEHKKFLNGLLMFGKNWN